MSPAASSLGAASPGPHFPPALATDWERGLPYGVFTPLHYECNYAYPLIVWLHGAGGNETQLGHVMPHVSLRNHAAVGPRAGGSLWEQTRAGIAHAERVVFDAVETVRDRLNVDANRIFLAGYQDGGVMALRVAMRHPRAFAGAASLCGPFPRGSAPLARLNDVRALPLLLLYGNESRRYPLDALCRDLELFHTAGLQAALRQYPCGDELTTVMLRDLDAWIMEHVTGESLLDCER